MHKIIPLVFCIATITATASRAQTSLALNDLFWEIEQRFDPVAARELGFSAVRVVQDGEDPYNFAEIDSNGRVLFYDHYMSATTYEYDSLGRLEESVEIGKEYGLGGLTVSTRFVYDLGGSMTRIHQTIERPPAGGDREWFDIDGMLRQNLRYSIERRRTAGLGSGDETCTLITESDSLPVHLRFDSDGELVSYVMLRSKKDTALVATMTHEACSYHCEFRTSGRKKEFSEGTITIDSCARSFTTIEFGRRDGSDYYGYSEQARGELDERGRLLRWEGLDRGMERVTELLRYEYDEAGLRTSVSWELYPDQYYVMEIDKSGVYGQRSLTKKELERPVATSEFRLFYDYHLSSRSAKPGIR